MEATNAPWVYVEDVHEHDGELVTLKGWLYAKRSSGKLHFLQVRDGTGTIQAVLFKGDVSPSSSTPRTSSRRRPRSSRAAR